MKARIYKPAKNTMQSGRGRTTDWILEYELLTDRKPEPLMGWVASGDTLNQVRLRFPTRDQAIEFAVKNNFQYTLSHAHERKVKPRNYADNFKYVPVDTKEAANKKEG